MHSLNAEWELLKTLEISLHQYEVRSDVEQLKKLLHPEFREIGYSGRTFDRQASLSDVSQEGKPNYQVWSQEYEFISLSGELVQLFYHQARLDPSGQLARFAKRTSIWQRTGERWQLRFHQGTPTEPFEKC